MSTLDDASSDRDFDAALAGHDAVIADFYTPSCTLCSKIEPMLGALERSFLGRLRVVKINAEANPALAARYAVRGVPTLVLLRDAEVVDRKTGFMTASMLREWVGPHLSR
jgi:thioredoxin-like negative regulator of GroEL